MGDARHVSVHHASTYLQDACARFALEKRTDGGVLKGNQVSPYEAIYSTHQIASEISELSATGRNKKTLPEVVDWWYLNIVKYSPTAPLQNFCTLLNAVACEARSAVIYPSEEAIERGILSIALNATLDISTKTQAIKSYVKKLLGAQLSESPQHCSASNKTSCDSPPTEPLHKKRKCVGCECDSLSERDSIVEKLLSPEERITVICAAYHQSHKDSSENLVHKDVSFYRRSIVMPGKCLTKCCEGDIPTFLGKYPNFSVASKFKCGCT
jgi:hypothetical protein